MLDLLASCAKCVLLDKRGEIPKESRVNGGAVIENLEGISIVVKWTRTLSGFIRYYGPRFAFIQLAVSRFPFCSGLLVRRLVRSRGVI